MLETSSRLLGLLGLLQSRAHWSGGELAERLEVGPRTIRRDVDRLRRLGYEVDATPGVAGGYALSAGASVPPLLLDEEEAVAIAVGLRTATGGGVTGIGETSVRALAKLERLLPARVRRRVGAIAAATVPYPASGPAVDPELLLVLASACRDHEGLRFAYRTREDAEARRRVQPQGLVHTGRRWYLVAWDVDRDDWRTFRVDRISGTPTADRRFAPREPPAADLAAYVAERIATVRDRYQATVVLHAAREDVADRVPLAYGTLEPLGPDRTLLRTSADWLDGLAVYIAAIGVDFEVRDPPELVEAVRSLGGRFTRATRASG